MGSIHCYASYLKRDDDIALNAAAAGWTNEFVEVVLEGSIILPIATTYLGLEAVAAATEGGSGFSLAFLTLPTLFQNWGWFAPWAGGMWFGLLFLAGLTSSLAMGQPWMAFLQETYAMTRCRAALVFARAAGLLGLVCVTLYPAGAFEEFDFWTGTFTLVLFALAEVLLFSWVFGLQRGWEEITRGADIRVPSCFRWIIQYVTPTFISLIFLSALLKPAADWSEAFWSFFQGEGWPLAADSVTGKILHLDAAAGPHAVPAGRVLIEDLVRLGLLVLLLVLLFCVRNSGPQRRRDEP